MKLSKLTNIPRQVANSFGRVFLDREKLNLLVTVLTGLLVVLLVILMRRKKRLQRQGPLTEQVRMPEEKRRRGEEPQVTGKGVAAASEAREPAYLSLRNILLAGGVLVGIAAFIHILSAVLLLFVPPPSRSAPEQPPSPRLQVDVEQDLTILQGTQQANVGAYGWVDQQAGIARIPVDRAMELLLEEGFPVLPQDNQVTTPSGPVEADDSGFPHPTHIPSTPPGPDATSVLTSPFGTTPTPVPSSGLSKALEEQSSRWTGDSFQSVSFRDPKLGILDGEPPGHDDPPGIVDLQEVRYDQRLGAQLPLDSVLTREDGTQVRAGDYFGSKPVVLIFAYYDCPKLCSIALNDLTQALQELQFTPGKEFNLLTVSFKPGETPDQAVAKKTTYLQLYDRPVADEGWHFLTGNEPAIQSLTEAAGFHYVYDPKSGEYAHPTGVVILTPEGKISRYIMGIGYQGRDLRLGILEAADRKIATPIDQFFLLCYRYNPESGRYDLVITNMLRVSALATVLVLGGVVIGYLYKERESIKNNPGRSIDPPRRDG